MYASTLSRKPGQVVRPQVRPHEAPAGAAQRIVGPALALDEERLVEVGLVVGVHVRGPHGVAAHRHVAVVVLVHAERQLGVGIGCAWNRRASANVRVDQRAGHAVVDDDEEADVLQRARAARRPWPRGRPAAPARYGPRSITGIPVVMAPSSSARCDQPFFFARSSTGSPAAFQAVKPPSSSVTPSSPICCAVSAASADRQAPLQKKTNSLPGAKASL